jgi:hypothetical protein
MGTLGPGEIKNFFREIRVNVSHHEDLKSIFLW